MTTFLALLWFSGSIAAIYFIVRPKSDWAPVANRKRAAGVFLAIFLGLPIVQAIVGGGSASTSEKTAHVGAKTPEQLAAEQKAEQERRETAALEDMRKSPATYLTLTNERANKDGFDTIFMLSGTINNNGKVAYKDPVIECEYYSETNTRLGRVKDTLYKDLPPGDSITFTEFNMGFANSEWQKYSCIIKGATPL
jgi:hypothetical protein